MAEPRHCSGWTKRVYSLGDTLKFVANKEAVHVDIDRDDQSRDMERVHFGHTTYPHFVAVLVASYVLERYRASRKESTELWGQFLGMSGEAVPEYKIIGGGNSRRRTFTRRGSPESSMTQGFSFQKPVGCGIRSRYRNTRRCVLDCCLQGERTCLGARLCEVDSQDRGSSPPYGNRSGH